MTLPRPPIRHVLATLLLGWMAFSLAAGALRDSTTVDEPRHVIRGLAYWWGGDARLSIAHPPLANALQAAPAAVATPYVDTKATRGWDEPWSLDHLSVAFLRADYEEARGWIIVGRFMTAALALLAGLYLYWMLLPYGQSVALLSLFVYAFHPVFLSHGRLATTDLALTAGVIFTTGETLRHLRLRSPWSVLRLGLAVGFTLSVKFSGLFVLPPLALALAIAAVFGSGRYDREMPVLRRLGRAGGELVVVGLVACLAINASYRFKHTGWTVERILEHPEPSNWISKPYEGRLLEELSPLPKLPAWMPVPLPYSYVFGLFTIKGQNERGHGGWFWGKRTGGKGARHYVPVMLGIKQTAGISLLFLGALALFVGQLATRRRPWPKAESAILWLMPLTFLALALPSRIQLGIRHLMPVVLFMGLAAAWGAAKLWERKGWARGLVVALLVLAAVETFANHPRTISHFNWLIGGSKVGHRISMVGEDWGQDIEDLAAFVKAQGITNFYYRPYGPASGHELRYHGVNYRHWSCRTRVKGPAWVAIHAPVLFRMSRDCGPVGPNKEPTRIINEHIRLFYIPAALEVRMD